METKYWIFSILLFQRSQILQIRLGFIANRKYKSTWCQAYRNTKPNQAKFCELILDVNTEKNYWLWLESSDSDFQLLFLQFQGRNILNFSFLVTSLTTFFKNFYVVQGFLLRVLVFKFFCKLFNFLVADGRKSARHAFILNNKRDARNQFNKRRESWRHWTIRHSQRWNTENTPLGSRMKWCMESTSGLVPSKTLSSI